MIISLTISGTFLFIVKNFSSSFKDHIIRESSRKTPLKQIIVYPKSNTLNFSTIGKNTSNITTDIIKNIASLPYVKEIYKEITYSAPVSLETTIFKQDFITDSLIYGVPFDFIKDDLKTQSAWLTEKEWLPILIPRKIIDIYNYSIGPNHGLPKINEEYLIGKEITIYLNYSTGFPNLNNGKEKKLTGKVVGFSDVINLAGITIPYNIVQKLNNKTSDDQKASQLHVTVDSEENIKKTADSIEKLDLQTEYLQKNIEQINKNYWYLIISLWFIELIIICLAISAVTSSTLSAVNERIKEIGILRALGATKRQIKQLFLYESAIIGLIGGIISIVSGILIIFGINYILKNKITSIVQMYIPPINITLATTVTVIALISIICIVGAYFPSQKAAKLKPIDALKR